MSSRLLEILFFMNMFSLLKIYIIHIHLMSCFQVLYCLHASSAHVHVRVGIIGRHMYLLIHLVRLIFMYLLLMFMIFHHMHCPIMPPRMRLLHELHDRLAYSVPPPPPPPPPPTLFIFLFINLIISLFIYLCMSYLSFPLKC